MLWFCRNPVCFVKAIIVKGVLFSGGCSKGSSFDAFCMDRVVCRIFSPELKDVVPIFVRSRSMSPAGG